MQDIKDFNPNDVGVEGNGIFGLPFTEDNSELIILNAPWEVTVSYRNGTARGPEKILEASKQVDLYDADAVDIWKKGFYLKEIDKDLLNKNYVLRHCAELIISNLLEGGATCDNKQLSDKLNEINIASEELKGSLKSKAIQTLNKGKRVALLGGDHSTPLGFLHAISEKFGEFGILQIDAHADLRNAFEGFKYSHASIMFNVLNEIKNVSKLVQVGIRDYCDEEYEFIQKSNGRVKTFFDHEIKRQQFKGQTWDKICDDIINELPQQVYISFDIDGLDPKLCPNTGTPVPGGFETEQIYYLFNKIVDSGRKIISFDLNEVSCGEHTHDGIDALVGARVLYKMCNLMLKSNL